MSALTACLVEEAKAIAAAAERIPHEQVELSLSLIEACSAKRSKIVITGVGKSGIVARKIAATFSSIGLMSIYLNPLDALHGDLGVVSPDDLAILLSNSGQTHELLQILPHLKRRGTSCISLVGRLDSTLARSSDAVLDCSVDREVCPLNLAPTASTAVAMAIGDALAVAWMQRQGISTSDFALNHPAGSLGRQLTLTVQDLMVPVTELSPLGEQTGLTDIISFLTSNSIGACWVASSVNSSKMSGIITDGDLRRALQKQHPSTWDQLTSVDIMTVDPITVDPHLLAVDALALMEQNRRKSVNVLPVINRAGNIQGLLRLHDLVKAGL